MPGRNAQNSFERSEQLPHALSAEMHEPADLGMASPNTIIYACIQTQGFGLSAFDLSHRQQFSDFESGLGLLLLDGQHALRVFVKPQRSQCASWQTVRVFHASLATENASHAPKLWSLAAVDAATLAFARSYFLLSVIRHLRQMLTAM